MHVYARVRGAIAEDGPSALAGVGIAVSRVGRSVELEGRGKFGPFSDVLGPDATQADTFDALAPVVDAAVAGRSHGTVLAYGQTGSGKTYSIGVHADGARAAAAHAAPRLRRRRRRRPHGLALVHAALPGARGSAQRRRRQRSGCARTAPTRGVRW